MIGLGEVYTYRVSNAKQINDPSRQWDNILEGWG